ncbi:VanZ family protein [Bacillus megaterium]|nr:VanZ family protein [Priestia megaterium]
MGMFFSVLIEIVQLFMPNRWTDIDDVLLNTLGTGIGYSLFKTLNYIKEDLITAFLWFVKGEKI